MKSDEELTSLLEREFDLYMLDMPRRSLAPQQRINKFKWITWSNLQNHTVNGSRKPSARAKSYINKGIRIEFTKEEFYKWCDEQHEVILNLFTLDDKPSLDRINPNGHYSLDNIRILPFRQNCGRSQREASELWFTANSKTCKKCGKILTRQTFSWGMETPSRYRRRKTCGYTWGCK